jgi:hypothetical protein
MPTTDDLFDLLQAVNEVTLKRIEEKIDDATDDVRDLLAPVPAARPPRPRPHLPPGSSAKGQAGKPRSRGLKRLGPRDQLVDYSKPRERPVWMTTEDEAASTFPSGRATSAASAAPGRRFPEPDAGPHSRVRDTSSCRACAATCSPGSAASTRPAQSSSDRQRSRATPASARCSSSAPERAQGARRRPSHGDESGAPRALHAFQASRLPDAPQEGTLPEETEGPVERLLF